MAAAPTSAEVVTVPGRALIHAPRPTLEALAESPARVARTRVRGRTAYILLDSRDVERVLTDKDRFAKGTERLHFRALLGDGSGTGRPSRQKEIAKAATGGVEAWRHQRRRGFLVGLRPAAMDGVVAATETEVEAALDRWLVARHRVGVVAQTRAMAARIATDWLWGLERCDPFLELLTKAGSTEWCCPAVRRHRWWPSSWLVDHNAPGAALPPALMVGRTLGQALASRRRLLTGIETHLQGTGRTSRGFASFDARTEGVGILFATFENVATAWSWALIVLSQCPLLQAWLYEDTDSGLRVDAFCRELLRLYPPIWSTARVAQNDSEWAPGTVLIASAWIQHRQRRTWEEPESFTPSRFLSTSAAYNGNYYPFGLGPATCVGTRLALQQLRILVRTVVRRSRITLESLPPVPLLGSTQTPDRECFLALKPR